MLAPAGTLVPFADPRWGMAGVGRRHVALRAARIPPASSQDKWQRRAASVPARRFTASRWADRLPSDGPRAAPASSSSARDFDGRPWSACVPAGAPAPLATPLPGTPSGWLAGFPRPRIRPRRRRRPDSQPSGISNSTSLGGSKRTKRLPDRSSRPANRRTNTCSTAHPDRTGRESADLVKTLLPARRVGLVGDEREHIGRRSIDGCPDLDNEHEPTSSAVMQVTGGLLLRVTRRVALVRVTTIIRRVADVKDLPRREQARRTRLRIIRAAHAEFIERGYHGATMAAIARRAGVATQTVYFVFHTKAELASGVIDTAVLGPDPTVPQDSTWWAEMRAAAHRAPGPEDVRGRNGSTPRPRCGGVRGRARRGSHRPGGPGHPPTPPPHASQRLPPGHRHPR